MPATKSIIQVNVQDDAFRAFHALYSKYQKQLSNSPAQWNQVNKTISQVGKNFANAAKAGQAFGNSLGKINKTQSIFSQSVVKTAGIFTGMAKSTSAIAANIHRATTSLLKWSRLTAIVSGLLGAGGLFGIERLAFSAAGMRRSAQGIGTSAAAQRAFGINYSRYFNTDNVLNNIANARSDLNQRWIFRAMGINNVMNRDPADIAAEMAIKARETFMRAGGTQQGAEAHGLLNIYSMDELRRLAATPKEELERRRREMQNDQNDLGLGDKTLQAWQNFTVQLERAGAKIEAVLINGLVGLAGPLGKLSDAFTKAVEALMRSQTMKDVLDAISRGLDRFASYIDSDKFGKDVSDFVDSIKVMGQVVHDFANWLRRTFHLGGGSDPTPGGGMTAPWTTPNWGGMPKPVWRQRDTPNEMQYNPFAKPSGGKRTEYTPFDAIEEKYGLPKGTLWGVYGVESSYGQNPGLSPKGALGPFQFMPDTGRDYGLMNDADRMDLGKSADAAGRYMRYLMMHYNNDLEKALVGYNWGPTKLDDELKASAKSNVDWHQGIPDESKNYLIKMRGILRENAPPTQSNGERVAIYIYNTTGGSAAVSTNALA